MTASDEIRRWAVRGVVQRVGFRMFVVREAKRLGLRGTVRNTSEGGVDVVATGPYEVLDQLYEKLRIGPDGAVVESVEQISHDDSLDDLPHIFMIVS